MAGGHSKHGYIDWWEIEEKKFGSLKLTHPLDEFVIFDTRLQDFIVVSDDLTTANMDTWDRMVWLFEWQWFWWYFLTVKYKLHCQLKFPFQI